MTNLGLIMLREYRQRVRAISFKMTTALGFALILGLAFAPTILDRIENTTQTAVAVVDPGERLAPALQEALPDKLPNGDPRLAVVAVRSAAEAEKGLKEGRYDGVLTPPSRPTRSPFVYAALHPKDETDRLRTALNALTAEQRLREAGLGQAQVDELVGSETLRVKGTDGATSEDQRQQSFWLVYALLFLLYFTILAYGQMVATGIIQEKSSRITEIMASAVNPTEQMAGKILGIGLLGLTQYGFWILAGVGALLLDGAGGGKFGIEIAAVPPRTLLLFVLFFVLGFLMYATFYAGLSSLAGRQEDATQLNLPILVVIVGGFLLSFLAMAEPESKLAVIASYVPLFSPMVMFTRAELGSVPAWEVALSVLLLVGAILVALWCAARVYRVGIFLYGKRPTFGQVFRLITTEGGK